MDATDVRIDILKEVAGLEAHCDSFSLVLLPLVALETRPLF